MNLSSGTFQLIGGAGNVAESMGALTSTWGGNTIRIDPGAGNNTITYASLAGNAVNGGSTLTFQSGTGGSSTFGSTNSQVFFTTAPTATPATSGIIQRAIVFDNTGGSPSYNFASYNHTGLAANTLGIQAYQGYNATNNLVTALNTDTMRLTANANINASRTLNALAINGVVTADSIALGTLTLTSGNILVQSGNATLGSNLQVAFGGTEGGLMVAPGSTLNVNAPISSSNNVTTGLGGTINFNTRQYFNTGANYLTINGSTVVLNGGDNTLFPGQTNGANNNLAIGPGATLNLNGNVQVAGDLRSPNSNAFGGSGGVVTSATPAVLVSRQANANWGGQITGAVTFVMGNNTAGNVERFYNDNNYTGKTLVTGGTLELTDGGRLTNTPVIDLSQGTLNILNTSANNGRMNLPDRVNDSAVINLRGGGLVFSGRAQSVSTETLGTVNLVRGNSQIIVNAGGTGVNSAEFTITNLNQTSIDATTNTQNATGQLGSTTRLFIGNGTSLVSNNILPVWIQNGASEFMTYIPTLGAMPLSAQGAPGYTGTTLPTVNNLTSATGNYRIGASGVVPTGGLTVNTLNINGAFNVTFGAATDVLNIGAQGLIKSGATGTSIGSAVDEGRLTSGGAAPVGTQPLYLYNAVNGNSFTINSRIVDNGVAPVRLIVNNFNGGTTVLTNPNNSYTGGTVVNGWINNSGGGLTMTGTGMIPAGGLTIDNSNVTATAAGQIHSSNNVNIAASSVLTLVGNNTLNSLIFDNYGGRAAPTVNTGGVLTLTNSISASSSNVTTLPVINGTLDFGGTPRTLTINPIQYDGRTLTNLQPTLNIAGTIQNAGQLTVDGGGRLQLSGQSTFTGGVLVKSTSGLVLGASSFSTSGPTLVSGPVGTGTLTVESGATLLSTGNFGIANPLVLQGNVNFAGINNLTFSGATTVPAAFTVNVDAPQQTVALVGTPSIPATAITKTGYGTLVLGTGYTAAVSLPSGGSLSLLNDGDGYGTANTITYGSTITSSGSTILTVGRLGTTYAPYLPTASNKMLAVPSLNVNGFDLLVNNNNGYGLEVTGAFALPNDQVINVATASASNVTQGMKLTGQVTGANGIIKQGPGTLVLDNATIPSAGSASWLTFKRASSLSAVMAPWVIRTTVSGLVSRVSVQGRCGPAALSARLAPSR